MYFEYFSNNFQRGGAKMEPLDTLASANFKTDKQNLLPDVKKFTIVVHAFSGCDITSSLYGFGKTLYVKLFNDFDLTVEVNIFLHSKSGKTEIKESGEKIFLCISKCQDKENLNEARNYLFSKKTCTNKNAVKLCQLPPTSEAAEQHSYRVYFQVQAWLGNHLDPEKWGWRKVGRHLAPAYTLKAPAPEQLIKIISCGCKKSCSSKCSCKKAGLNYSNMCLNCQGIRYLNSVTSENIENSNPDDNLGDILE